MIKHIERFLAAYRAEYSRMYDADEYDADAVQAFDELLKADPATVAALAAARGDAFTSDREAAALVHTLRAFDDRPRIFFTPYTVTIDGAGTFAASYHVGNSYYGVPGRVTVIFDAGTRIALTVHWEEAAFSAALAAANNASFTDTGTPFEPFHYPEPKPAPTAAEPVEPEPEPEEPEEETIHIKLRALTPADALRAARNIFPDRPEEPFPAADPTPDEPETLTAADIRARLAARRMKKGA